MQLINFTSPTLWFEQEWQSRIQTNSSVKNLAKIAISMCSGVNLPQGYTWLVRFRQRETFIAYHNLSIASCLAKQEHHSSCEKMQCSSNTKTNFKTMYKQLPYQVSSL